MAGFVWVLGTHWQKGHPHSLFRERCMAGGREPLSSMCWIRYRRTHVVSPGPRKRTGDRR